VCIVFVRRPVHKLANWKCGDCGGEADPSITVAQDDQELPAMMLCRDCTHSVCVACFKKRTRANSKVGECDAAPVLTKVPPALVVPLLLAHVYRIFLPVRRFLDMFVKYFLL